MLSMDASLATVAEAREYDDCVVDDAWAAKTDPGNQMKVRMRTLVLPKMVIVVMPILLLELKTPKVMENPHGLLVTSNATGVINSCTCVTITFPMWFIS